MTGAAAAAILLLALVLRIFGAHGELWLDEIWSLKLIDEMKARHDLFWGLALDNNHYLNTLYLYLVGADAPVLVQRALSILLGTATVAVSGLVMRRSGTAGMLCTMALFAVSYTMVNYGSEARGYAGLILMTLLGLMLTEPAAAGSSSARRKLGLVNVLGVLFQPIMLGGIAGLIAWSTWINRPSGRPNTRAILASVGATARTFSWTVRFLIPVAAIIAFSVLHAGGYRIADTVPFTVGGFVAGYGGTLHLLLGLPDAVPDWVALVFGAIIAAAGWHLLRRRAPHHGALYLIFLVGLPLAMFLARLPNPQFPRYYLAPAIVFLLLLADLFAAAWNRGGVARLLGLALIAAIATGNAADTWRLLRDGRDQSASVVRLVGESGPVLVTSDQDFRHRPIVEFFAQRFNLPIIYVPSGEICTQQPQWLVSTSVGADMPEVLDASVLGCNKVFKKQTSFPRWGLSGLPWTVYRLME